MTTKTTKAISNKKMQSLPIISMSPRISFAIFKKSYLPRRLSDREIKYYSKLMSKESCPLILKAVFDYLSTEHWENAQRFKKIEDEIEKIVIKERNKLPITKADRGIIWIMYEILNRFLRLLDLDDLLRKIHKAVKTDDKQKILKYDNEYWEILKQDYKTKKMSERMSNLMKMIRMFD